MKFKILALTFLSTSTFAAEYFITTNGSNFTPDDITISIGDSVTFTNGGGFHNVVSDTNTSQANAFRCAEGCDGDGGNGDASGSNWSFTLTFFSEEMIGYFCEIHGSSGGGGMSGTINVIDDHIFNNGFESAP